MTVPPDPRLRRTVFILWVIACMVVAVFLVWSIVDQVR